MKAIKPVLYLLVIGVLVSGCGSFGTQTATRVNPTVPPIVNPGGYLGLTDVQTTTLLSLEQIDDYPLYRMEYWAEYPYSSTPIYRSAGVQAGSLSWGCSLFAALGVQEGFLYGRNFDWETSPALLLYTYPPEGYDSVSMVDIAYLGYEGRAAAGLADRPLEDLLPLLHAPWIPFDGLNEMGLAVGMAAVPPGNMTPDPAKPTIGSLGIIREVLDHAAEVDDAISIMKSYQIDFEGGPPIHYLVADRHGQAVLVEYHQGEMRIIPNQDPWHLATNFLVSAYDQDEGVCSRYDMIQSEMTKNHGNLTPTQALLLLERVSQGNTQWSVVYGLKTGEIQVVMDRDYNQVVPQQLEMREP